MGSGRASRRAGPLRAESGHQMSFGAFYRATLCVSAVVAVAGVLPSVTFVYCMIQTAEDVIKLLSPPGRPIIPVFLTPSANTPNSKGTPFSGSAKYTGVGKFCDFRLKSPFIWETVRDRPMVMELQQKVIFLANRYMSVPMTLTDF